MAAASLAKSLKPGGMIVFTAPQASQLHDVPADYFRYTKEGVLKILET